MGLRLAAAAWGLAEATLFFIVPDVLLTAVALRDRETALRCCLWTLGGALLGGALMFAWATHAPEAAVASVDHVPAVTEQMLTRVQSGLADSGVLAMFLGPLSGTPYKLYAVFAPAAGIGLPAFLLISIPARLIRFVLVVLLTNLTARTLLKRRSSRTRLALVMGFWITFYALYFAVLT
ncbi:MAG: hypothetical protein ACRDQB_15000 [Thermocrispum sp.]